MKAIEIESWALRVLERVEAKAPVEDSRVELKSDWPDAVKAARRLAGHANAARGENILWLVGADEKQGVVTGANYQDLATWFAQVTSCFDVVAPSLQDLNVTYKGKTVAALCFDTSRAPYVVKNPKGGEIQFELSWRDGTAIRTANRSELILMLSPLIKAPRVELLEGQMRLISKDEFPHLQLELTAYIVPRTGDLMVFPNHKLSAQVLSGGLVVVESLSIKVETRRSRYEEQRHRMEISNAVRTSVGLRNRPLVDIGSRDIADTVARTDDELLVKGPGKFFVSGSGFPLRYSGQDTFELQLHLIEAVSEIPVLIVGEFARVKDASSEQHPNRWTLKNNNTLQPRQT